MVAKDIFKPYMIMEKSGSLLHLKLTSSNRLISIITLRLLPFLMMLLVLYVFYLDQYRMPVKFYIGLVIIFIVLIFMLFTKIVCDVYFNDDEIKIVSYTAINKKYQIYPLQDIIHIRLAIFAGGRSRGAYYSLKLIDKSKVKLFNLPILFSLNKEKLKLVNQKIEEITNLKIEGNLEKLY